MNITYRLRDGRSAEIVNVHRYDVRDSVEGVVRRLPGQITLKLRDSAESLTFNYADVVRVEIDVEA